MLNSSFSTGIGLTEMGQFLKPLENKCLQIGPSGYFPLILVSFDDDSNILLDYIQYRTFILQ